MNRRNIMQKEERIKILKEILKENSIANQESLVQLLEKEGVEVTQSTLSRDLRELRVSKVPDPFTGTRYVLPSELAETTGSLNLPPQAEGVISLEFSGNLAVLRTIPGFANSVAYYIDNLRIPELLGTIAGDDTILLIARENVSKNTLAGSLLKYFPKLESAIS